MTFPDIVVEPHICMLRPPAVTRFAEMNGHARLSDLVELVRRLLPVVVCALGLGWHGETNASSISSDTGAHADEHAQYCKCRGCRTESCCCGPRSSRVAKPVAVRQPGPAQTGDSPCMSEAPCGSDRSLPGGESPGVASKAARSVSAHFSVRASGRLLPPLARCALPTRRTSLVEEPPESPLAR